MGIDGENGGNDSNKTNPTALSGKTAGTGKLFVLLSKNMSTLNLILHLIILSVLTFNYILINSLGNDSTTNDLKNKS